MEPEDTQTTSQMQVDSPCCSAMSPVSLNNLANVPVFGTVTPNRIFVGGIDFKTKENDLRTFFTQYGTVKEVKIVNDRAGVSKGYGFVTFETQEDAQKILQEAKKLNYKDKKLNIGPAVRKQQTRTSQTGTMYLTTSSGYPYVYHNGMAYFHTSEVASTPQTWPSCSPSSSPVMVAQPVYHSSPCHYQVLTQCLPSQLQWSASQSPASSPSLMYLQPSEVIYQTVGIPQENGYPSPPLLVETAAPELFPDHGVQAAHHQPYVQSTMAVPVPALWSIHY